MTTNYFYNIWKQFFLLSIGRPNNLTMVKYFAIASDQASEELCKSTRTHQNRFLGTTLKAKYIS